MFEANATYPTAVAGYDDAGVDAAFQWCIDLMEKGDTLTAWTKPQVEPASTSPVGQHRS